MSSVPVNLCPIYAPVLGAFGVAFALVFACNATFLVLNKLSSNIVPSIIFLPSL